MPRYCDNQNRSQTFHPVRLLSQLFPSGQVLIHSWVQSLSFPLVRSTCPRHRSLKPTRWLTNSVFSNLAQAVLGYSESVRFTFEPLSMQVVLHLILKTAARKHHSGRPTLQAEKHRKNFIFYVLFPLEVCMWGSVVACGGLG